MADDLEKFLQRAAQRRRQRTQPSIVLINEDTIREREVEPEIVDAIPVGRSRLTDGESVKEHVEHHLDTRGFAERASHLGERVGNADDKMDQHIQSVFDHQLGNLSHDDNAELISDDQPAPTVVHNWIADMLRNPATLSKAIVLNEIMTPAFRRM